MNKRCAQNRLAGYWSIVPVLLLLSACGHGEDSRVEAGRALAQENCTRCHEIGPVGESPLAEAPPFGRLRDRYKIDDLAEAFAEGIVRGHKEMPPFDFTQRQIDDLLAYLKSLERR